MNKCKFTTNSIIGFKNISSTLLLNSETNIVNNLSEPDIKIGSKWIELFNFGKLIDPYQAFCGIVIKVTEKEVFLKTENDIIRITKSEFIERYTNITQTVFKTNI